MQLPAVAAAAANNNKESALLSDKLREQTDLLWQTKDSLKDVHDLKTILCQNDQPAHGGRPDMLHRVAEGMLYGALQACKKCNSCAWVRDATGYRCGGMVNEWEPCDFTTVNPPRKAWVIPEPLRDLAPFLDYRFKKHKMMFAAKSVLSTTQQVAGAKRKAVSGSVSHETAASAAAATPTPTALASAAAPLLPLAGLSVATSGRFIGTQASMKARLAALGAHLHSGKLGSGVVCLVSTADDVDKNSKKVAEANKFGVRGNRRRFMARTANTTTIITAATT